LILFLEKVISLNKVLSWSLIDTWLYIINIVLLIWAPVFLMILTLPNLLWWLLLYGSFGFLLNRLALILLIIIALLLRKVLMTTLVRGSRLLIIFTFGKRHRHLSLMVRAFAAVIGKSWWIISGWSISLSQIHTRI
jgi:hypothetical protein